MGEKQLIKSAIYDDFICIADKCSFTCCQQWKIAVDEDTYRDWCKQQLSKHVVVKKDSGRVIRLNEQKICPFLNSKGLCEVVLKYGEEMISDTCHTFPRQTHDFGDRTELSVVNCCPYVVDLLREKSIENSDLLIGESNPCCDLYLVRQRLMDTMLDSGVSIGRAWKSNFEQMFSILEDESENESGSIDFLSRLREWNALFLDVSDNYIKEGLYKKELNKLVDIATDVEALFNGEKVDNAILENRIKDADSFEKIYLEYEHEMEQYAPLLRYIIANDFYTNMLLPDSDIEHMMVMLEWSAMTYVVLRYALYLDYLIKDKIDYEDVRAYIVVTSRMTGYDEEDIWEYMENSFENIIWIWDYINLLFDFAD